MASRFSRVARIGSMGLGVGASYLGQRVSGLFQSAEEREKSLEATHLANAERVVANLGAMKGAAMKLGQTMAMLASSVELPPEAKAILGKLHDRAEPVPFDQIRARVEADLAGDLGTLFRSFDPTPLGTASLGQAHAALLPDGTPVVVKVLHAGVEGSVAADLGAVKAMMVTGRVLQRERSELDAIFAELEERLNEELDYRREAANLTEFRAAFTGNPDVRIPAVFPGWCTERVLTMERITGRPLPVFLATAGEEARQRAAETLCNAFMCMEYRIRAVHADPHPGNYLFTPEGRVGILDFGCVRRYDVQWMSDYGHIGYHGIRGERDACIEHALKIGALAYRHPGSEDVFWELCQNISRPFTGGAFQLGGAEDVVQERIVAMKVRLMSQPAIRAPRELVFLHRGLMGTYTILRQLRAKLDYREMFLRWTAICFADAERLRAVS